MDEKKIERAEETLEEPFRKMLKMLIQLAEEPDYYKQSGSSAGENG